MINFDNAFPSVAERLKVRLLSALSWIGVSICFLSAIAVFLNNIYYSSLQVYSITNFLFALSFLLALVGGIYGFMALITLLPLVAGLHTILELLLKVKFLALPNAGLDLVAGFFLGTFFLSLFNYIFRKKSLNSRKSFYLPWPIGLALIFLTFSTWLSIVRNLRMSASYTSVEGIYFNIIHFRPIGWHDDYLPIADWIAYGLAGAMIALAVFFLKDKRNSNTIIFRPLMIGLFVAVIMGIIQNRTGFGLPENLLSFRHDYLGFAAIGFQPDLHAFAGHLLLGVGGLAGYWLVIKPPIERAAIIAVAMLCLFGVLISKSRASLVFAFIIFGLEILVYVWIFRKKFFITTLILFSLTPTIFFIGAFFYFQLISPIPMLGWVNNFFELLIIKSHFSINDLGGILGSRFEIYAAAFNMFLNYPLMGVGQGDFYRLSAIESFSRSYFLSRNGGENAHNYFLQVLVENGLIGAGIFLYALIYPWIEIRNRKYLYPATFGLLALFMGNIYSHSFLVRENLMLASVLVGLMFSWQISDPKLKIMSDPFQLQMVESCWHKLKRFFLGAIKLKIFFSLAIFSFACYEIYTSFNRKPFLAGINCFISKPISHDGWSSGVYEFTLPTGTKEVSLTLEAIQPHLGKHPLTANLTILDNDGYDLPNAIYTWREPGLIKLSISLPSILLESRKPLNARLRLSNCFTPRDLGVTTDGRHLGVLVRSP